VERKREYYQIFPEGLEILHKKRERQVNIIVMEDFKSVLFHKSGPANKQHYLSINLSYWKESSRKAWA
jgi:hypothetical protein